MIAFNLGESHLHAHIQSELSRKIGQKKKKKKKKFESAAVILNIISYIIARQLERDDGVEKRQGDALQ